MAEIQKQNISVTPGSLQIETSGGYVTAISGRPIAGGSGGGSITEKYYGDNINVQISNDNTISLTPGATAQLYRSIPTKVTDLTDSANYALKTEIPDSITDFTDTSAVIYSYLYPLTADIQSQINGKQSQLQFDLNAKGEISAIGTLYHTTALAGANGITGDYYSASNPSGFINSAQAETQILEKHYLTEASGNSLYVPIPNGLSDGQYYAMTTSSWKVIQGAGDVSGISTVAHDDTLTGNGNNENLGVDITKIQTKLTEAQIQNITDVTTLKTASSTWDNVSAKLDTTAAAQTYQTKGDYVKNTDISLDANSKVTAISGKELIITAHQSLTNYYTKDETSGATQLAQAFANLPGGGITEVSHDTTLTGKGNSTQNLGVAWSALSSNTIDYSNSAFNLTNGTSVSSFDQISAAIDDRYSKSSSNDRFLQKSLDSTLTGDGTTNKKLGVAWSALSANTINSANSAGEAKGFRWSDNSYQDTSAALTNLWNAKNHVTLQAADNILTVDNNDNTSATLSAMSYVVNPNNAYWKPQRSCVCTEAEISTMAGYANGQGMLFFVVSGHSNS